MTGTLAPLAGRWSPTGLQGDALLPCWVLHLEKSSWHPICVFLWCAILVVVVYGAVKATRGERLVSNRILTQLDTRQHGDDSKRMNLYMLGRRQGGGNASGTTFDRRDSQVWCFAERQTQDEDQWLLCWNTTIHALADGLAQWYSPECTTDESGERGRTIADPLHSRLSVSVDHTGPKPPGDDSCDDPLVTHRRISDSGTRHMLTMEVPHDVLTWVGIFISRRDGEADDGPRSTLLHQRR